MKFSKRLGLTPTAAIAFALLLAVPPLTAGSGSDAYGYTWVDSQDPDGPVIELHSRQGGGFEIPSGADWTQDVVLPFPFPYYGVFFDTVRLSDNGFATFDLTSGVEPANKPIPDPADTPDDILAALWGDLSPQQIQWGPILGGEGFLVNWDGNAGGIDFTVDLILFPDGVFRYQYWTISEIPDTTIGIESPGGTYGIENFYNGAGPSAGSLLNGYVIEYTPPPTPSCADVVPATCGTTSASTPAAEPPLTAGGYSCAPGEPMLAWERVMELNLTEASTVQAALGNLGGRDLRLFHLDGCDSRNCLTGNAASIDMGLLPPGNHLVVVDGPDSAAEGDFDFEVTCTDPFVPLACGELASESNVGQPSLFASHPCDPSGRTTDGGERAFRICLPSPQTLRVSLNTTNDLDLFLYGDSFDAAGCLDAGDNGVTLFGADAGCYHLFVDGPAGAEGDFDLEVTCGSELDCASPPEIVCGGTVSGDTAADGTASIDEYPCTAGFYDGPEMIYRFENPKLQNVSFVLENTALEMDLLLLSACDEGFCSRAADGTLNAGELEPGTYYVVVDGRSGVGAPFDISAFCAEALEPDTLETTLRAGETVSEQKTAFLTPDIPQADVMFAMDLTGSMDGELANLQQNAKQVIDALSLLINDLSFGLISFEDYPATYSGAENCGYAATYARPGDAPYRLNLPLQKSISAFEDAVNAMTLGNGEDGPESYARVLWETANHDTIGWRPGSRRMVVMFGDNIPHDCDVDACVSPGGRNSGWDPGRDGFLNTFDDIALLDAVDDMAAPGHDIVLLYFDSSGGIELSLWDCLARRTGGFATPLNPDGTPPSGIDLSDLIFDAISEEGRTCETLTLEASAGFESWLLSVTPTSYADVLLPDTRVFDIVLGPPAGTPPGTYQFTVDLLCEGVVVASQQVTMHVGDCTLTAVPPDDSLACEGSLIDLDGSRSIANGCNGDVEYQWSRNGTVIRPWDANPSTSDPLPGTAATYTLEITCRNDPNCPGTSAASFDVGLLPDELPQPLGRSLRVAKTQPEDLTISWDGNVIDPSLLDTFQVIVLDADDVSPPTPADMEAAMVLGETVPPTGELLHAGAQLRPCDTGGGPTSCRLLYYKARGTSPCSGTPGSACDGFPAQVPCP